MPHRGHGRLSEVPHIAGLVLGVFSVLCALWSISPGLRYLTAIPRRYIDAYYFDAPDTSLVTALMVGLLAGAIATRKRIAWWLLVAYMALFILANALDVADERDPHALVALVVHVAVIGLLIAAWPEFYTQVRRGALWKALGTLVGGLTIGWLLGWGLIELFPGSLPRGVERPLWSASRVVPAVLFGADNFDGHPPHFVNLLLGLLGALALLAAAIVLFRSQRSSNALTGLDESALRGLLERSDIEDSLGYFATRRDKAVVFAPSGKAAVTYRVELGVCLASGDPIGSTQAWPQAIDAWLRLADQYGWAPAVMGASELGAQAYRQAGLSALRLGDEAILDTRSFSLAGPEMKQVRQAANRLRKQGIAVRIRRHRELSAAEMAQVIQRADAWRDTETERGFSMALGRLGDPLDGDCLLVEAVEGERVWGMLSLVPWGRTGVSLDLMRRDPKGPNGIMELMISQLALTSEQYGITKVSLNFAVFRSVFEEGGRIGAGPVLRLWRSVLMFFSRWWQLEALYRSNVKYQPQWVPRFFIFEDRRQLVRAGVASALAEGFLPRFGKQPDALAHTGLHSVVPPTITGLHADGSPPELPPEDLEPAQPRRPEQVRVRMDKLARLETEGVDAYPVAYPPTHTVAAARRSPKGTTVRVCGRLLRIRDYGGVIFAVLRDWSDDIQLVIDRGRVGAALAGEFDKYFDLGDLIEVSGQIGHSRRGELSLLAQDWRMIGKCLHPLPDKWKGLADPEARVRQRYVDMAVNAETREVLAKRSAVVRSLRDTLHGWGFLEVETPVLQQVHGGANAAPFTTHINAYDLDLYLRIAPELYLKRLCVGGMEKVFELGRVFRNEGVDYSHNPEFTILEAYEAHSDYERMMHACRQLIQEAAIAANGKCVAVRTDANGAPVEVDISGDWPVRTVHGAISDAIGETISPDTDVERLRVLCDKAGVPHQPGWDAGQIVLEMYEHLVEARTEAPTFYIDFPTSVSPLTRAHRSIPGVAERWDLVAWGVELGTAYSELTNPLEQRRRLTEQSLLAAGGDPEAMELDEDFLQALEFAMPPTGGLGIGVDRVVMLITGRSIRETLPFPLVKPR
ncbi:bifunctional lysylphosphatidylglycerol synthetase/lysine--tRNA ligase LysX [Nocardia sp. CDC159]|uniref:Lysine--tRNA ligase n=1 Tax=Nocardia pulmonis TaxID=2951408 RepID=A0A9X2J1E6_9NOCA|nr:MULTISPECIES: bifunctional lysylphosphatidylglycerol synthetase/lysine--tRNA ligase LysX [Nocardia]MCM6776921.1 bifunctional lysylphosphatidylglycerol synthetase/lysine--tRNA ligase LysX [Nocardia pulmonis]MCM6789345.1 bifunctional lysylphosphatidylglycerol synthetase/lysine--tRNA ligase LysX [Nocardia sp. CDC159]